MSQNEEVSYRRREGNHVSERHRGEKRTQKKKTGRVDEPKRRSFLPSARRRAQSGSSRLNISIFWRSSSRLLMQASTAAGPPFAAIRPVLRAAKRLRSSPRSKPMLISPTSSSPMHTKQGRTPPRIFSRNQRPEAKNTNRERGEGGGWVTGEGSGFRRCGRRGIYRRAAPQRLSREWNMRAGPQDGRRESHETRRVGWARAALPIRHVSSRWVRHGFELPLPKLQTHFLR
jgi:hypothetical protein